MSLNKTKYSADKAIKLFSASFMSNAKWRTFFLKVAAAKLELNYSEWKIVGSDFIEKHRMPFESDICETHFADGHFQPFKYKYIEWIFIPRRYKPLPSIGYIVDQNIDQLVETLNTGKKFPFEVNEKGFAIFGYK